jgi:hypothetical protein
MSGKKRLFSTQKRLKLQVYLICFLVSNAMSLWELNQIALRLVIGKFLSIPTQMNVSTGSAPLSLLLQFPVPCKGGVPSVVQLMVSYDPSVARGTRIQFGALDSKLPVTETLGRFEDQVDEVVRRAGPLAAVGWLHAQLKTS